MNVMLSLGLVLAIAPTGILAEDATTPGAVVQDNAVNPPPKPQAVPNPQAAANKAQAVADTAEGAAQSATTPTKPTPKKVMKKKQAKKKAKPAPSSGSNSGYGNLKDIPDPMDLNSD